MDYSVYSSGLGQVIKKILYLVQIIDYELKFSLRKDFLDEKMAKEYFEQKLADYTSFISRKVYTSHETTYTFFTNSYFFGNSKNAEISLIMLEF